MEKSMAVIKLKTKNFSIMHNNYIVCILSRKFLRKHIHADLYVNHGLYHGFEAINIAKCVLSHASRQYRYLLHKPTIFFSESELNEVKDDLKVVLAKMNYILTFTDTFIDSYNPDIHKDINIDKKFHVEFDILRKDNETCEIFIDFDI